MTFKVTLHFLVIQFSGLKFKEIDLELLVHQTSTEILLNSDIPVVGSRNLAPLLLSCRRAYVAETKHNIEFG